MSIKFGNLIAGNADTRNTSTRIEISSIPVLSKQLQHVTGASIIIVNQALHYWCMCAVIQKMYNVFTIGYIDGSNRAENTHWSTQQLLLLEGLDSFTFSHKQTHVRI